LSATREGSAPGWRRIGSGGSCSAAGPMMSSPSSASTQTSFEAPRRQRAAEIPGIADAREPAGQHAPGVPSKIAKTRSASGAGASPSPSTQGTREATGRRVAA
jgi:hypothetical protein